MKKLISKYASLFLVSLVLNVPIYSDDIHVNDESFLDNATQFIEDSGISTETNVNVAPIVELYTVPADNEPHNKQPSQNRKNRSFGLSFSEIAKMTVKDESEKEIDQQKQSKNVEQSKPRKKSFGFTFGEMAGYTNVNKIPTKNNN